MGTDSYAYDSPGTVSAVFFGKMDAERAYSGLLRLGYTENEISLLMSDETVDKRSYEPYEEGVPEEKGAKGETGLIARYKRFMAQAIVSLTSGIALPELGKSLSKRLTRSVTDSARQGGIHHFLMNSSAEERQSDQGTSMREGGIIISVDPKNRAERAAVVREFQTNRGRDILGDDGYTELD
jgi:hypothetical protein